MNSPIPVTFGGACHVAGWYSDGANDTGSRRSGVLLCPPIGHEYMCAHRAFRRLADKLSRLGFPVLRFDYRGTGDSGDCDDEKSLVPAWHESVNDAADELRRLSGCDRLSLIGLRFGATLAASAAFQRDDVDSLVLWCPVADGQTMIRQTRMLALATAEHPGELSRESEGLEAAGFFINSATVADIATTRFPSRSGTGPTRALLLSRDDLAPDGRILRSLVESGMICDEAPSDDHTNFLVTPLKSVLPERTIDTITRWMDRHDPSAVQRSASASARCSHVTAWAALPNGITETHVSFAGGLAGVLVLPAVDQGLSPVVVLNTGADHHVGPHRLFTPLTREWASIGFPVLRFDLRGLGDSEDDGALPTSAPYPESAIADVRAAVTYVRDELELGAPILAGICSGAYHAVHAAERGIAGVIAVNPPLYHHPGDPIEDDPYSVSVESSRVVRALRNPQKWRRLVRGNVDLRYTLSIVAAQIAGKVRALGARLRAVAAGGASDRTDLADLFHDGVRTHLIFSSNDPSYLFFNRAVSRKVPLSVALNDLTIDVVDGADHTFMFVKWQKELSSLMTRRLMQHRRSDSDSAALTESAART